MENYVNPILKYKDSCDMYVINSYRKKNQYALSFDGVDDYVITGDINWLSDSIAVQASVFLDGNRDHTIFRINQASTGLFGLDFINGNIRFFLYGAPVILDFPATEFLNQNITITGVYDNSLGLMSVYVNEDLKASRNVSIALNQGVVGDALFGFNNNSAKNIWMKGLILDARIWNTARTAQQIQDNLNKKLTGNEPGLFAYYDFSAGSGTTLFDKTANGNHGTVFGATWVEI